MEKYTKITVCTAIITVITAGWIMFNHNQQAQINAEVQSQQKVLEKKQDELKNIPQQVTNNLLKDNNSSNARQIKDSNEASDRTKTFFTELYHIDSEMSQSEWTDRIKNLHQYATDGVIKYTALDYESQGINRKDNLKIKVKDVNITTSISADNAVSGLAKVTYVQSSNIQDYPEKKTVCWQFVYNMTTKKIDAILSLGQLKSQKYEE